MTFWLHRQAAQAPVSPEHLLHNHAPGTMLVCGRQANSSAPFLQGIPLATCDSAGAISLWDGPEDVANGGIQARSS